MEKKYNYKDIEYEISYGLNVSYCDSLEELHKDIIWHHECLGSYQGSYYHIGINKDNIYYLKVNSYGSCSGCDWIEGIVNQEEAEEFFKHQEKLQCLGDNKEEVLKYIKKEIENVWDFEEENYTNIKNWINKIEKKIYMCDNPDCVGSVSYKKTKCMYCNWMLKND